MIPEIPTISIDSLLRRRKYRNVVHLITAWYSCFDAGDNKLNFQDHIVDNETATIAFRIVQFGIGKTYFEDVCLDYVLGKDFRQSTQAIKHKLRELKKKRRELLAGFRIQNDFLDCPPTKTADRFIKMMEEWRGYRTYGDNEGFWHHI